MNEYLKKVTKTINSVRYGNLSARLEDAAGYEELTASINRMIEALSDREKMIVEYRNELQHSLDREKEFVAALTHDLKVPIIAQNNVVDFLLEGRFGEVTEPQRTALQNIQTSGRELLKLVQTLLETHKEHGVVKEKIDLKPFIDRIVDEMRPAAGALKITTVHKCKRVDADPFALERVLKNLISNAILHGQADVEVKTFASKGFVKICVSDFGQGISPADAPHIFDKFYHAGKKCLSTGLGLYLSQQIVCAHEGEITLNCKKGTEFCIKLPIYS